MTNSGGSQRHYETLTAPAAAARIGGPSVLCLPVGSIEQHGPHLPLNTDTVIAERFTDILTAEYGDEFDLWALPPFPYGLAHEHAATPGTVTLDIATFTQALTVIVGEYLRTTGARHLVVVNGHGGNRGVLGSLIYQVRQEHQAAVCVMHPTAMAKLPTSGGTPEIHAALHETSLMLALAPALVHLDRLTGSREQPCREEITRQVVDRGVTWPWSSADPGIAADGVLGNDPRHATTELGTLILGAAVTTAGFVLQALTGPGSPLCP